jgi:hypothetical protein
MEQSLIKTMQLSNGLELDFYDISRKLAGDLKNGIPSADLDRYLEVGAF